MKSEDLYKSRAEIFKALAHPTRLMFVDALSEGERCVCELNAMVDADVSTVSKHLSVMKNAGVVSSRREGTNIYYSLKMTCVGNFMKCVDSEIRASAESKVASLGVK